MPYLSIQAAYRMSPGPSTVLVAIASVIFGADLALRFGFQASPPESVTPATTSGSDTVVSVVVPHPQVQQPVQGKSKAQKRRRKKQASSSYLAQAWSYLVWIASLSTAASVGGAVGRLFNRKPTATAEAITNLEVRISQLALDTDGASTTSTHSSPPRHGPDLVARARRVAASRRDRVLAPLSIGGNWKGRLA